MAQQPPEGVVTVLFTDIVGSAALTGENGSVTVSRLTAGQLVAKGYAGTVVVKDATPASKLTWPIGVPLSTKVTFPLGVPAPGARAETVVVNVTC